MREYVGGSFTIFDAMALPPEDFKAIFVTAAGNNAAERARIKKNSKKPTA